MIQYNPTIKLSKLKITKAGHQVYYSQFHSGVNIIRGMNSSGKTTILNFIAFALGAENIPWNQEALLCDEVFAEIALNDKFVTVSREVSEKPQQAFKVYWGKMDEALSAPIVDWETYPFRRSSDKISFTQALFLMLGLPEAKSEGASNITTHQILRMVYADQPSLHSPIFRDDTFDTNLTRRTVGNYLCGIYNDELYLYEIELRDLEKEKEKISAELKGIYTVLSKSGQVSDVNFLASRISDAEADRQAERKKIEELKAGRGAGVRGSDGGVEVDLRSKLNAAKLQLEQARTKTQRLAVDVADTKKFIDEIGFRLENLNDSELVRSSFGKLTFHVCPACLSALSPSFDDNHCGLCHQHLDNSANNNQIVRMRNELSIQLRESNAILKEKLAELDRTKALLPALQDELKSLENQYYLYFSYWSSSQEEQIEQCSRRLGELDQELKNLHEQQRLASAVEALNKRIEFIDFRLAFIKSNIQNLSFQEDFRRKESYACITETLAELLRKDLPRQNEFENASEVKISFEDNEIVVNGAKKFSESSTVVLRHLFHLSMLSASTKLHYMRFPRLLILDGIEDGGMELPRSYRLQEIIVEKAKGFDCDYQLIFATSQISPLLDNEDFVVDRSYSEDKKSLSIY